MTSEKIVIFHVFAWIVSAFSLYTYHSYVLTQIKQTYGRQWKYLTYINLHIQLLCFTMCILKDFTEYIQMPKLSTNIRKIKEIFYAAIGVPTSITVFVSFWAIYAVDRELIHPEHLDEILPPWTNHFWHTTILITVVEVACDRHKYPKRSLGITICSMFGLAYFAWLFWINKQSGIWVYPFLDELKGIWFFSFFVVEILFSWLTYLLGEFLNNMTGSFYCEEKQK